MADQNWDEPLRTVTMADTPAEFENWGPSSPWPRDTRTHFEMRLALLQDYYPINLDPHSVELHRANKSKTVFPSTIPPSLASHFPADIKSTLIYESPPCMHRSKMPRKEKP